MGNEAGGRCVYLVTQSDYESHEVLAAFSDLVRAEQYRDEIDGKYEREVDNRFVVERLEIDLPRESLPGEYVVWVGPDGEEEDREFMTWQRHRNDGTRMSHGGGRGHGDTWEEALDNARRFAVERQPIEGKDE